MLNREDLDRLEALDDLSIRLPATLLVEATTSGELLESREYRGMPVREETRRRNLLACGATGAGKTYRFALPAIDAVYRETDDALVILNIKGPGGTEELRRLATRHRPGEPFLVFSPADADRSIAWNPVAFARRHTMTASLVEMLLGPAPHESHDSAFWDSVARRIIGAALGHRATSSLAMLADLLSDVRSLAAFARSRRDRVLLEFVRFVESGSHNAGTNLADINARLHPFARTEAIRAVLSGRNEVDLVALLTSNRPFTLVVEANEATFSSDRPILNLFFSMLFGSIIRAGESNGGTLSTPLSIFLDEFGAIGRIHEFETVANTSRSRHVSITAMVQTLSQLGHHYGEAASSVISAFNSKLFFCSGLDLADREYASRLSGRITVESWRETEQYDAVQGRFVPGSRTQDFWTRPLLSPEDLAIPEHHLFGPLTVLFTPDHPPAMMHLTASWEIPHVLDALEPRATAKPAERSIMHPASERRLGIELATGECRTWWDGLKRRMSHQPAMLARIVRELETRDATLQELHEAIKHSGTRSIRGNLLYLELARQAAREQRFGVPWPLRPRSRPAPKPDPQRFLFTTCDACGMARPDNDTPCPHCAGIEGLPF